ncbi:hypothetical protein ACTJKO_00600 [Curtobacterium sp. 22159]|uniref:hypothetical protein n=1 Tax=Curtobacterium sp. 22159 TaxID=3453882 RepID=UPI003F849159
MSGIVTLSTIGAIITATLTAGVAPSISRGLWATLGIVLLLWALSTSTVGVVAAAFLPPLKPLHQTSVLGQRGYSFSKWSLAVGALFGTTMLSATTSSMVTASATSGDLQVAITSVGTVLLSVAACGAFFYWLWIPFDLWRAGRTRRMLAVLRAAAAYRRVAADHEWIPLPPIVCRAAAAASRSATGLLFAFYTSAAAVLIAFIFRSEFLALITAHVV